MTNVADDDEFIPWDFHRSQLTLEGAGGNSREDFDLKPELDDEMFPRSNDSLML